MGIPTVTLNLIRRVAELVKPPRAASLPFPFGSPVGEPGNIEQQLGVIRTALSLLETAEVPGTISQMPFKWK